MLFTLLLPSLSLSLFLSFSFFLSLSPQLPSPLLSSSHLVEYGQCSVVVIVTVTVVVVVIFLAVVVVVIVYFKGCYFEFWIYEL
jgi:ABC-type Co2+ transport system permease subunit